MKQLQQTFNRNAKQLAPSGSRVLLACSAGGDSMALFELAFAARATLGWSLGVVHVDHRQRPESADEAAFVARRAAARDLPFFLERLSDDLDRTQTPEKLSEEALRERRHEAFRRAARAFHADAIALAHHADDRAETLLLRLFAGSGPTGLAGVRGLERIGGLTLIRPLLSLRRADLRQWLRERNIEWCDDPTNDQTVTTRGWIRNDLLPSIAARTGGDPTDRIRAAAELIEQEAAAADAMARLVLDALAMPAPEPLLARLNLNHPFWMNAPAEARRQLLRIWLWSHRRRPYPPGRKAVEEALAFAAKARPAAELRTVERMHAVHARTSLLLFPNDVTQPERAATTARLMQEIWT